MNIFRKNMNYSYLNDKDIKELQKIRKQYIPNEKEFEDYKEFMIKHKKPLTLVNSENKRNLLEIIDNEFRKVINNPKYAILKDNLINCRSEFERNQITFENLPKVVPDYFSKRALYFKFDIEGLCNSIRDSLRFNYEMNQLNEYIDFDYEGFIFNPDFDVNIYRVENLNKQLNKNTTAIIQAYESFFELVTAKLNKEQKEIIRNNFIEGFQHYLNFNDSQMTKTKNNNYRNMVKYFHEHSNK